MRNIFIISLLSLLLICCNNDWLMDNSCHVVPNNLMDYSSSVSEQEALAAVSLFLESSDICANKNDSKRRVKNIYSTASLATKSSQDLLPLCYIINFEDSLGFAIAAADHRLPPVLCVIERGNLDVDNFNISINPGMAAMLSRIDTQCRMLLGLPINDSEGNTFTSSYYRQFINLGNGINFDPDSCNVYWSLSQTYSPVGTQVGCTWDQGDPFNKMCPLDSGVRSDVGCTPVAVGQIMFYHKKNTTYNGTFYNWNLMKYITSTSTDTTSYPYNVAWAKVQNLLVDLGDDYNLDAEYSSHGTPASDFFAPRTFEHFGYQSGGINTSLSSSSYNTIASDIASGYPVLSIGYRVSKRIYSSGVQVDSTMSGHTWVIDQTMRTLWRMWVVHKRTNELVYGTYVYKDMVHCNWGWDGDHNGFFLWNVFDLYDSNAIMDTKSTRDTINVSGCFYKHNIRFVTGIRP